MQNIINLDQKLNIPSVQIDILRKDFISTDIFFKDIVQFIDYNDEILIFDVYTCLLLLDLSLRNENKTNRPLTSKDNLNILKSLLVLNEEIVKRNEDSSLKILKGSDDKIITANLYVFLQLRFFDIKFKTPWLFYYTQLIKFYYLRKFLEFPKNTHLLEKFLEKNKEHSLCMYFDRIYRLVKSYIETNNLLFDIRIDNSTITKKDLEFLNNFTINYNEPNYEDDFIRLRQFPLYKHSNNKFFVLFYPFVLDKLYRSIFFDLNNIVKFEKINVNDRILKDFSSYYGKEFSEKYLFYSVIKDIFIYKKFAMISGEELENKKIVGGCDFYIRNGKKVFLFENKNILLDKKIKTSFNVDQIRKEFYKKLVKYTKNNKDVNTAVLQLITNIQKIFNGEFNEVDKALLHTKVRIYPIIIIHDFLYNTTGLNILVNNWFYEELKQLFIQNDISQKQLNKIKKITIVSIDDLIFYAEYIKKNKFKFDEALEAYFKIEDDKKLNHERFDSFHSFLFKYLKGKINVTDFKLSKELKYKIKYLVSESGDIP